jgi:hypothetical protein
MMNLKIESLKAAVFLVCGAFLFAQLQPESVPRIEYKDKIVTVEKKVASVHTVTKILPDGSKTVVEDEITEYLKNFNAESALKVSPESFPKHTVLAVVNQDGVAGAAYQYRVGRASVGLLYNSGLFGTVGWSF